MENATKALLFAGGVLVVIILIALGIQMVNSTNPTTEQVRATLSAQEIQTYNAQFIQHEGTQKGSAVKDLLRLIYINNLNNNNKIHLYEESSSGGGIDIGTDLAGSDSLEYNQLLDSIKITSTYQIRIKLSDTTGLVNEIKITD